MVNRDYAFSLAHDERGWTWRVFDAAGAIVGAGRRTTQQAAQSAAIRRINTVLRQSVFRDLRDRVREASTQDLGSEQQSWVA